ncbi:MAG: hypothetical protein K9W44_17270 [Candidatus Lokiarchaeota archaeon]|nr:hypothetical protein [Candidatus Harpocratesius repetitus]
MHQLDWEYPLLFYSIEKEFWDTIFPKLPLMKAKLVDTRLMYEYSLE